MIKIWKDPVWSSVIAGIFLALILAVGQYLFDLLGYTTVVARWFWSTITANVFVPLWLLIIAIPILVLLIPLATWLIQDKKPSYTKYECDHILGIDWSWKWIPPNKFRTDYKFDELIPRCPGCKSVLSINDYDGRLVYCINESCEWQWPLATQRYAPYHVGHRSDAIDHSSKLNDRVMKEIDRKLHTGEWENG